MSSTAPSLPDDSIIYELPMAIRIYRSGRVERLVDDDIVPASLDPDTGVQSKDVAINPSTGLSARLYLPPSATSGGPHRTHLPILLYFHGGAFCVLRAFSALYHKHLTALTAKSRVLTVSVDYRLAPENPLPAAYDDSWETLRWIVDSQSDPWVSNFGDLGRIFLAGDSAGGNIVHNLGVRIGGEGMKVEGVVLAHPYFWGKERIGSEGDERRKKSMRTVKDADGLWPIVCPRSSGLDDPWVNPLADGGRSLAALGCRRVLVCVAELDLLRDRGAAYYERVRVCGWEGEAEFSEIEGEDHVFFLFKPSCSKTAEYMEQLVKFFNKE